MKSIPESVNPDIQGNCKSVIKGVQTVVRRTRSNNFFECSFEVHEVLSIKQRILILSSVVFVVGFQFSLFMAMQRFQVRKPDFANLYQAGRKLDHERFPMVIARFPAMNSQAYSVEVNAHELSPDNMHPPYEMVLYTALALLKFRTAYVVWWGCNSCFLFLTAWVLWPHVPGLQSNYPYLLILIATFFPVLVALVQGQNSLLLLALLTFAFHSLVKRREYLAGFLLSMGMFKFVLVIPIACWLVLEKRWKSLAGFLSGCGFLFFTSVWLVGIRGIETYIRMLVGFGTKAPEQSGTESIMPNLRGLFHALCGAVAPEGLLTVLTLVCSLALLIWVDSCLSSYGDLGSRFSVQILLAVSISYHLYPHDAAVLVIPTLVLLDRALRQARQKRFRASVQICTACLYFIPLVGGLNVGMLAVGLGCLCLLATARNAQLTMAGPVTP